MLMKLIIHKGMTFYNIKKLKAPKKWDKEATSDNLYQRDFLFSVSSGLYCLYKTLMIMKLIIRKGMSFYNIKILKVHKKWGKQATPDN